MVEELFYSVVWPLSYRRPDANTLVEIERYRERPLAAQISKGEGHFNFEGNLSPINTFPIAEDALKCPEVIENKHEKDLTNLQRLDVSPSSECRMPVPFGPRLEPLSHRACCPPFRQESCDNPTPYCSMTPLCE